MITLTKKRIDEIWEAWAYGAAGSCKWAISELGDYMIASYSGQKVLIENDNLIIDNYLDFIDWKINNLSEIPILTDIEQIALISVVKELNIRNGYNFCKIIELKLSDLGFSYIQILNLTSRKILRIEMSVHDKLNFPELDFEFNNLELIYGFDKKIRLKFEINKTHSIFKLASKNYYELIINRIEIK
jgi:hypothetical protein